MNDCVRKGKWKKPTLSNRGYYTVTLHKDGESKCFPVHRLVAICFKPEGYSPELQVNHIDEDKTNNHASNLEWVTAQYNTEYSQAKAYKLQYGAEVIEVFNLRKFCRDNNLDHSAMRKVLRGSRKSHMGYRRYEN